MEEEQPGKNYTEYKLIPQFWGWLLVILASAAVIALGMWVHAIIPERAREWDYGALPQTPAASVYSTQPASGVESPLQMAPLPEAEPLQNPARPGED